MTSTSKRLPGIVLGALVIFVTLFFTMKDGGPETILRNRLAVSLLLMLPGAIALLFKGPTLRFVYVLWELTRLADDESERRAAQQVTFVGAWALLTGFAIAFGAFAL